MTHIQPIASNTAAPTIKPVFTSAPDNKPAADIQEKKTSNTVKAVIGTAGALAIAATIIGGIRYKKGKDIAKEVKELMKTCKIGYSAQHVKNNYNNNEQIAKRLEEISKLKPKEQLSALKQLETDMSNLNLLAYWRQMDGKGVSKVMETVPAEVKKALDDNDILKAAELYRQLGVNLPKGRVLSNNGATVAETIENTFGKGSKIKPHTYDKAQEYDVITVYRNQGGYKEGYVNSKNEVISGSNGVMLKDDDILCRSYMHADTIKAVGGNKKDFAVLEGTVHGSNRRQVQLYINGPERDTAGRAIPYKINILSPDGNLTPVQKDLLELAKNPEKFDRRIFDRILEGPETVQEMIDGVTHVNTYKYLNYDLLLSAIQSMVK